MIKLLPINSRLSTGELTGHKYHVIKQYTHYDLSEDNMLIVSERAEEKHLWGDCRHCKKVKEYLDKKARQNQEDVD